MKSIAQGALLVAVLSSLAPAQTAKTRPVSPLKTGVAQFDAEKLDQAKVTLTPLGKAGDPEAMYYIGRIAIEQSNGDEAVDWLQQATTKNDKSSLYHQWLGMAYAAKAQAAGPFAMMGIAPDMKRAMERAVELDSTNVEARINLTQFYLQAPPMIGGGIDKAREQVVAIARIDPYRGKLQEATVAESQKDTVAAEQLLRDVAKAFPDSSTPVIRLSLYYANLKRYDDAFRVLEDRVKRAPNDAPAMYQIGRVGAVSGTKLDRAQWALNRYLKVPHTRGTPSIAAAHWRLGMVLEAKGDKKTAKSEYETALQLDPKLAGAKASLDKIK